MDLVVGLEILVLLVLVWFFIFRSARQLQRGWKYKLRWRGKIVKVLDKPGFYMVSPFLSAKRVRVDDQGARK